MCITARELNKHSTKTNGSYISRSTPIGMAGSGHICGKAISIRLAAEKLLLPVAFEYNPEIIIVSAGYDAAVGCPEGLMKVTPAAYGHMTHALSCLAGGKLAVMLEGGYFLESLAESAVCTIESLLGLPPCPLPSLGAPHPVVATAILDAISVLRPYWKSLAFQETDKTKTRSHRITYPVHTPRILFDPPKEIPGHNTCFSSAPLRPASEIVDLRYQVRELRVIYDAFRAALPVNRSCYVYDEIMLNHIPDTHLPEVPARISRIYNYLNRKLLPKCVHLPSRNVTEAELNLIHEKNFTKLILETPANFYREGSRRINNMHVKLKDRWANDLDVSLGTQPATLVAAGSLLNIVDAVVQGKCLNGYAIVRPPGHHAHHTYPAGFCFANNVAIAAQHAIEKYGLKRILIVDWDVHHGDGVQELFYKDPRILYISLHRGKEDFYPPSRKDVGYVGAEKGYGFNVNIPWSHKGMHNGDYVAAFLQLVMPLAYEFSPELVFVCSGFDAALNDPLGECCLTEIGYETMTKMLLALAGGRVIVALEGGYNLEMLEKCSESVMKALMGFASAAEPISLCPSSRAVKDIKAAADAHIFPKHNWKCLQYRVTLLEPVDQTEANPKQQDKKKKEINPGDLADALRDVHLNSGVGV
ncbi:histone deacetylase 6-like [Paramacrobiotus metropolitanus]|uniref:histone deacetylase 6-like n=1 Tax=Paramacrobiotus metropolitanus TaxID=2943436 RepID=UPI0024456B07|nr:histone deacetylase 6-like [Paramacrobiotus metropolitanus]